MDKILGHLLVFVSLATTLVSLLSLYEELKTRNIILSENLESRYLKLNRIHIRNSAFRALYAFSHTILAVLLLLNNSNQTLIFFAIGILILTDSFTVVNSLVDRNERERIRFSEDS